MKVIKEYAEHKELTAREEREMYYKIYQTDKLYGTSDGYYFDCIEHAQTRVNEMLPSLEDKTITVYNRDKV